VHLGSIFHAAPRRGKGILRAMVTLRRWAAVSLVAIGCAGQGQRAAPVAASEAPAAAPGGTFVYVGLPGEVAAFRLDPTAGTLSRRGAVPVGRVPASLAYSSEREELVAVDEATGNAFALGVAKSGGLSSVGRAATGAAQPTGATADRTGKYVLAAHRGGGRVSVLALAPGGRMDVIDTFASGAGAAAVAVHPANQVAFVSNFRAGTVSQFSFNTGTGMLTPKPGPPLALPAGAGPTRFACHPSGRWVYLLNEGSDAISVHVFDEDLKALSALSAQIVTTLPDGAARAKSKPADLAVRPDGKFVYVTNRGHDSVAIFAVEAGGTLKLVGHEPTGGRQAGAVAVDPSGAILVVANEGSRSLSVFHVDAEAGTLGGRRTVGLPASPLAVLATRL
jgi:6-phosphogluconolactonase